MNEKVFELPFLRIKRVGEKGLKAADRRIESILNMRDLRSYQKILRKKFNRVMGPLPDIKRQVPVALGKTFRYADIEVQQVTAVSENGYDITGWFFRRYDLKNSIPGIVVAMGHAELASLQPSYFKLSLYAAKCGFCVFAFDPPGQGARREVFYPGDHPVYWSPCNQHQHLGAVSTQAGINLTRFFVSDCMTAVSVLCQNPDVDSERIGFAGQSGGGNQTYYAMAADPRVKAAVPAQSGYTRRGEFMMAVVDDIEQDHLNAWSEGLDKQEMTLLFAPKPVRILSEFGNLSDGGIFRQIAPVYERIGYSDRIEIASGSLDHTFGPACREITLNWFFRHLDCADHLAVEPTMLKVEEFRLKLVSHVKRINARDRGIVKLCQDRVAERTRSKKNVKQTIKSTPWLRASFSSRRYPVENEQGRATSRIRTGKYFCRLQSDYAIPFSVTTGQKKKGVTIIADEAGCESAWTGKMIRSATSRSRRVIALDVFNCGKVRSTVKKPKEGFIAKHWWLYGPDHIHSQQAFMAGKCSAGLALEEIRAVIHSAGVKEAEPLFLAGRGWPGLSMLLLSATDDRVSGCRLSRVPESLEMLVNAGCQILDYNYIIPGLVMDIDLPEIIAGTPSVKYCIDEPVRPLSVPDTRLF